MAVAQLKSSNAILDKPCSCYKVTDLVDTILDSQQIANLEDRYCLGEQLGWGQFGVIKECSDKLTGEILACKSIAKERLVTDDDLRSIKLEIEIMSKLSGHPNVVDLIAVYEDDKFVHLVMELCAGGELFHRLEKHGRFSEFDARVLFRHLMLVVMYCHDNGVVHRDLKPENILLATKASSSPIKLADFGLATYIKPDQSLYGTVGSPFYIAPEVLAGGYNEAADVWSAGVILYILLSGMPPFWGKTKSKIFDAVRAANLRFPSDPWDHISASAKDLITGMLRTDPSQRLTAAQVLDHSWMKEPLQQLDKFYECENANCDNLDPFHESFSTPFISRNQDISFCSKYPVSAESQHGVSTSLTCKTSFSSYMAADDTPCLVSGGFSFRSCGKSNSLKFSSPISSMPSFTFFGPSSPVEEVNNPLTFSVNMTPSDDGGRETSLGQLFKPSDPSVVRVTEEKPIETRRGSRTSGSRTLDIRSKRNRTIGLGEFEQLDLMVTESVIRWASCTPSLRSSLVC